MRKYKYLYIFHLRLGCFLQYLYYYNYILKCKGGKWTVNFWSCCNLQLHT